MIYKAFTAILIENADFVKGFFSDFTTKLLEYIEINYHLINLDKYQ